MWFFHSCFSLEAFRANYRYSSVNELVKFRALRFSLFLFLHKTKKKMLKPEEYVQIILIILTTLSTLSTACIYSSRDSIERAMAVHVTLTTISIVLAIEITYHIVNPRPPEYTILGGVISECILIGILVLYELIPTFYRLDKYEGIPKYMRIEELLVKSFAFIGVVTATLTFIINRATIFKDLEDTAKRLIDGYGLLFIIPALGVGEAFMMRWGSGGGMLACTICCTPIIYLVLYYFDLLTALTYISTAMAFFSDAIFGCRHFLKIRYQQENSGEQEMGQV